MLAGTICTARAAGLAAVALLCGCGQSTTELRLITPPLPVDQSIAESLAAQVGPESGVRIRLVPAPDDGTTALDALAAGYGDIAFAANTQPYRDDVATVLPLYPSILHVLVRTERVSDDIATLLRGARIYAGPAGSASRQLLEWVMHDLELTPADVSFSEDPAGSPDVVVVYAPISRDRLRDFSGFTLMSFGTPEEIGHGSTIDRATLLNPRLTPFVIPVGTYGDLTPSAVVTLAVDKLLVARSDLPEAAVYDLLREIMRVWPALSGSKPGLFRRFGEDFDASSSTFALHPGSQAYIQRDAPTFIERYSSAAEVLVTLLIGLTSGTYAAVNIYRIRRKNRIDEFYKEVMAIRNSITAELSPAEREDAVRIVRSLQNRAFDMLIQEKLAANDSFRIYVTLSNDTIRELRDGAT